MISIAPSALALVISGGFALGLVLGWLSTRRLGRIEAWQEGYAAGRIEERAIASGFIKAMQLHGAEQERDADSGKGERR